MRTLSHKFLNAALYQVGWFCCMLIAEPLCGLIATALILIFHVSTGGECLKELSFIFAAATLGYSMDLALRGFGYIDLTVNTNGTAYLILLWVLFATSLRSSMLSILGWFCRPSLGPTSVITTFCGVILLFPALADILSVVR